ncbi:SDR family oxidoreductase [Actinomadura spongiicola]|uniref:SDR family oxidoreductase n=1 Tax=Actinomadura spongiicola TaxID=2303421 RepID=A0A372GMQ4_9ACTN|nr:SDR family NAD(P)-dependent oxidoreductase [Actinomadura spongiicola]RFS86625.1 SDR family oxidoreductase [Actinomadura spongiicola]
MATTTHDFTGRTVIVTGAGRGIGLALARYFHAAGAVVWLVGRDAEAIKQAAHDLDGARIARADVTRSPDVERVVLDVVADTGRVDVLINNAGVLRDRVLWKLTDEDWETVQAVHLGGTFRFMRACVPHFRAQGRGRVVNVTSYAGLHGNVGQAAYAAAKAGVIGLTKTAAKELVRFGTTVNAISPVAETRMITSLSERAGDQLRSLIPAGRFAPPEDICAAAGFLASDEAHYVTGVVLPVDGGMSI